MRPMFRVLWSVVFLAAELFAQAQQRQPAAAGAAVRPESNYQLSVNDQVMIKALNAEEIGDRPYRIDESGELTIPIVGKVRAAGRTVVELEAELLAQLRKYIRDPQVGVTLVQFRSETIFLVGAFQNPGIHPLEGRRSLVDLLSRTSPLLPNASRRIRVTRQLSSGRLPLATAVDDPVAQVSRVDINLNRLMETVNPEEDILLMPFDVISAQRTEMVYINGEVIRPGGFDLADRDSFPVTHLLSLAGGTNEMAAPEKCRVLRQVLDTTRRVEIPIDLKKILNGQANDFPIMANDVLVVPRRPAKFRLGSVVAIAVPAATTLFIALIRTR